MSAENPYAEINEAAEQAQHHAAESRRWATAADEAAIAAENPDQREAHREAERSKRCAAVSQAHAAAATATMVAAGCQMVQDLKR